VPIPLHYCPRVLINLLSSPRRRRRLGWIGLAAVAVSSAVAVVALAPGGKQLPPDRLSAGVETPQEREVQLTPAMRRGIVRTLERFVPAAVARENTALAWELAGPGLRAGSTRREWLRGDLPVVPFPVEQKRYDSWQVAYAYRDRVAFDLMLMPTKESRRGPLAVSIDVVRQKQRWLVDSWYVSAVFTGPDERPWVRGAPDFEAGGYDERSYDRPQFAKSRLGAGWFALPLALFACVALVPLVLGLRGFQRSRRATAAYARAARS
jgi:hypothetical protein